MDAELGWRVQQQMISGRLHIVMTVVIEYHEFDT